MSQSQTQLTRNLQLIKMKIGQEIKAKKVPHKEGHYVICNFDLKTGKSYFMGFEKITLWDRISTFIGHHSFLLSFPFLLATFLSWVFLPFPYNLPIGISFFIVGFLIKRMEIIRCP